MNFLGKSKKERKFVYNPEKGVLVSKGIKGEKLPPGAVLCSASPIVITKEKVQIQNPKLKKN